MERSTISKFGKPSISTGHGFHGKMLVITRLGFRNSSADPSENLSHAMPGVVIPIGMMSVVSIHMGLSENVVYP